ncbi:F-box/FBD/LRR-repeat protein At2g04230-like [Bidens hawaiensis]|uniref:F-box/FBD/LRR-repeat protein At2g04230-like n=1 Tax=Bidens hawaiensis TaxID=980011 RepID=UPI004049F6CA
MKRLRGEEENETRFTDLPESLQLHILSSLETKHDVQALMLLKSCGGSWTSLPALSFNSNIGFDSLYAFNRFVFNVFSLREPVKLDKLSFKSRGICNVKMLTKVQDYALLHGVKELEMDIAHVKCTTWPFGLHASSHSITNLKLASSRTDMGCLFLGGRTGLFKNCHEQYFFKRFTKNLDHRYNDLTKLTTLKNV